MRPYLIVAAAAALLAACGDGSGGAGAQRDTVWAAGSSTVFPFTTRVAENFAQRTGGTAPRVESLGTGGGIAAFCAGVGTQTPDIANASRRMKASEFDQCVANGVTDIIEIQIGYDGIVIATARDGADFAFSDSDLYMALAAQVPGDGEQFVPNPHASWDQVRAGLPAQRIQVYGPPPTSGTRDSWLELAMTPSAEAMPQLSALAESDEDRFETLAHTLREDGAWIDAGENDNAIVQTLTRTPGALGVFGFSFLEQNMDQVKAATVNGVAPTVETIASGEYPISRSMFIYVKKAHIGVVPNLEQFVAEYVSENSMGRGGYLQDRGLIPLDAERYAATREAVTAQTIMSRPEE